MSCEKTGNVLTLRRETFISNPSLINDERDYDTLVIESEPLTKTDTFCMNSDEIEIFWKKIGTTIKKVEIKSSDNEIWSPEFKQIFIINQMFWQCKELIIHNYSGFKLLLPIFFVNKSKFDQIHIKPILLEDDFIDFNLQNILLNCQFENLILYCCISYSHESIKNFVVNMDENYDIAFNCDLLPCFKNPNSNGFELIKIQIHRTSRYAMVIKPLAVIEKIGNIIEMDLNLYDMCHAIHQVKCRSQNNESEAEFDENCYLHMESEVISPIEINHDTTENHDENFNSFRQTDLIIPIMGENGKYEILAICDDPSLEPGFWDDEMIGIFLDTYKKNVSSLILELSEDALRKPDYVNLLTAINKYFSRIHCFSSKIDCANLISVEFYKRNKKLKIINVVEKMLDVTLSSDGALTIIHVSPNFDMILRKCNQIENLVFSCQIMYRTKIILDLFKKIACKFKKLNKITFNCNTLPCCYNDYNYNNLLLLTKLSIEFEYVNRAFKCQYEYCNVTVKPLILNKIGDLPNMSNYLKCASDHVIFDATTSNGGMIILKKNNILSFDSEPFSGILKFNERYDTLILDNFECFGDLKNLQTKKIWRRLGRSVENLYIYSDYASEEDKLKFELKHNIIKRNFHDIKEIVIDNELDLAILNQKFLCNNKLECIELHPNILNLMHGHHKVLNDIFKFCKQLKLITFGCLIPYNFCIISELFSTWNDTILFAEEIIFFCSGNICCCQMNNLSVTKIQIEIASIGIDERITIRPLNLSENNKNSFWVPFENTICFDSHEILNVRKSMSKILKKPCTLVLDKNVELTSDCKNVCYVLSRKVTVNKILLDTFYNDTKDFNFLSSKHYTKFWNILAESVKEIEYDYVGYSDPIDGEILYVNDDESIDREFYRIEREILYGNNEDPRGEEYENDKVDDHDYDCDTDSDYDDGTDYDHDSNNSYDSDSDEKVSIHLSDDTSYTEEDFYVKKNEKTKINITEIDLNENPESVLQRLKSINQLVHPSLPSSENSFNYNSDHSVHDDENFSSTASSKIICVNKSSEESSENSFNWFYKTYDSYNPRDFEYMSHLDIIKFHFINMKKLIVKCIDYDEFFRDLSDYFYLFNTNLEEIEILNKTMFKKRILFIKYKRDDTFSCNEILKNLFTKCKSLKKLVIDCILPLEAHTINNIFSELNFELFQMDEIIFECEPLPYFSDFTKYLWVIHKMQLDFIRTDTCHTIIIKPLVIKENILPVTGEAENSCCSLGHQIFKSDYVQEFYFDKESQRSCLKYFEACFKSFSKLTFLQLENCSARIVNLIAKHLTELKECVLSFNVPMDKWPPILKLKLLKISVLNYSVLKNHQKISMEIEELFKICPELNTVHYNSMVFNKNNSQSEETSEETLNNLFNIYNFSIMLPPEVMQKIFGYLSFNQQLMCRVVCKQWFEILSSSSFSSIRTLDFKDDLISSNSTIVSFFRNSQFKYNKIIFRSDNITNENLTEFWKKIGQEIIEIHFDGIEENFENYLITGFNLNHVPKLKVLSFQTLDQFINLVSSNNPEWIKIFDKIQTLRIETTNKPKTDYELEMRNLENLEMKFLLDFDTMNLFFNQIQFPSIKSLQIHSLTPNVALETFFHSNFQFGQLKNLEIGKEKGTWEFSEIELIIENCTNLNRIAIGIPVGYVNQKLYPKLAYVLLSYIITLNEVCFKKLSENVFKPYKYFVWKEKKLKEFHQKIDDISENLTKFPSKLMRRFHGNRHPEQNVNEISEIVFRYLKYEDLLTCRLVCKTWFDQISSSSSMTSIHTIDFKHEYLSSESKLVKTFINSQFNYKKIILRGGGVAKSDDLFHFWNHIGLEITEIHFASYLDNYDNYFDSGFCQINFPQLKTLTFDAFDQFVELLSNENSEWRNFLNTVETLKLNNFLLILDQNDLINLDIGMKNLKNLVIKFDLDLISLNCIFNCITFRKIQTLKLCDLNENVSLELLFETKMRFKQLIELEIARGGSAWTMTDFEIIAKNCPKLNSISIGISFEFTNKKDLTELAESLFHGIEKLNKVTFKYRTLSIQEYVPYKTILRHREVIEKTISRPESRIFKMSDIEEEEIHARHRKEKKDLHAKITALKKSSGKKNKKEVQAEIEKLEKELDAKHLDELKNLKITQNQSTSSDSVKPQLVAPESFISNNHDTDQPQKLSKAQKRREKKNEKERERQAEIEKESEANKDGPRNTENKKISDILENRHLSIFPIAADGDCLYNSIIHQLKSTGREALTVSELRNITAEYIRNHKVELLPYITNPDTDECLNDIEFEEYCDNIMSTKCWGGQIEIMAISNALKVPIEVLQAAGPPTLQTKTGYEEPKLVLTYHRHFVSLGEHYNSTQPLIISEEE
uniref:CSON001510 protein n=1 Tax=Culicoides sonorensis TaxID=179676 RepID=A0A336LQZ0_CULSO